MTCQTAAAVLGTLAQGDLHGAGGEGRVPVGLGLEPGQTVRLVLGVARLGEADLRGWWRSHGLDAAGSYVLSGLFPRTWRSAALQLDISSAKRMHEDLLDRPTAVHLFSDQLPCRRWAQAWLDEQTTLDPHPFFAELQQWDESTALGTLQGWAAEADAVVHSQGAAAEELGRGLRLGTIERAALDEARQVERAAARLAAAYLDQGLELRPPYLDLDG